MVRHLAVIVSVLATIALNSAAWAESPTGGAGDTQVKQLLLLMDKDKNGKVSRKEFMAFMTAEFNRLDVNKDGELDVNELENLRVTATKHPGGAGSK